MEMMNADNLDSFFTNDYSIEVSFAGDSFEPDVATRITGQAPTKVGVKGELRHPDRNDGARWSESFWSREIHSRFIN